MSFMIAPHQTLDDRLNVQMTRLLREAAQVREVRERARSSADGHLARREATALLHAIRTRGQPKTKHDIPRRPRRSPVGSHTAERGSSPTRSPDLQNE